MPKNVGLNEDNIKYNIQKLYLILDKYRLLDAMKQRCGFARLAAIRWTYQTGRISDLQCSIWKEFTGVQRQYLVGAAHITDSELLKADTYAREIALNQYNIADSAQETEQQEKSEFDTYIERIQSTKQLEELEEIQVELKALMSNVEVKLNRLKK